MSFNFGSTSTPKTAATGFTLPSNPTVTTAGGFQPNFGSGDSKAQTKPTSSLFGSPAGQTQPLSFGSLPKTNITGTSTPSFGFTTPASTTTVSSHSFGATVTNSSAPATTAQTTSKPGSTLISLLSSPSATTASTTGLSFGVAPSTTSSASPSFGLTTSSAASSISAPLKLPTTTTTSVSLPSTISNTTSVPTFATTTSSSTGSLTFGQLEDSINKWTMDLEEQGKFFINQAKQLNAWDSLLISNGEKILNLNSSIEQVKQQQQKLDQELDFVLAQQKELEELIVPLEKELLEIPVTDIDRNQMYQFSEVIDSQLKQMSDDLKEIIEHINESNKEEEISNPITQVSKILNAHMNSLQWIDRNTAQISSHLEEISKMQDSNRRNTNFNQSYNNSFNM
ncbi:nuclear pore glycoprotein p62 [Diorhabda carinulata]|uniref:nuclear pore glycoprotein p62 n=1 Tax=Diorhabda carinulata TaxID=1163345 RepID=UPI0025A23AFF|nr:nuclear pore glycoprotein p62 [Diorhabda carinulata]